MNAAEAGTARTTPRTACTISLDVAVMTAVRAAGTVAIAAEPPGAPHATSNARAPRASAGAGQPRDVGHPARADTTLAERLAVVLRAPVAPAPMVRWELRWPGAFFDYQIAGIQALLSRGSLLLADDMGLGKTIQAIAALRVLVVHRRVASALVVVPAGVVSQWRRELRRWAPELRVSTIRGPAADRSWQWDAPASVYLTSYETLRSDFTDNRRSPPRRRVWDLVILDEAQKLKNRDTDVSRKCKQLRRHRTWALSGTPLENSVDDLASVLEVVAPADAGTEPLRLAPGPALRQRQQAVQLRRRKADVLPELPPKIVSHVTLPLGREQRESYDRAEREGVVELREAGATLRIENVLALIVRLKQICNFCPRTGRSAKLEDVRERIEILAGQGHRALVFSQFTDATYGARAIERALGPFRPLRYTGELTPEERDSVLRRFREREEHRVLVLSLRAAGQGLNLQDASYVFHFDRWWNPAVERQAEDRTHRLGQRLPVNVYTYTMERTIEERIATVLRDKQLLFDELVDDVSLDLRSTLTADEIFGLFGMARPGPRGRSPTPGR